MLLVVFLAQHRATTSAIARAPAPRTQIVVETRSVEVPVYRDRIVIHTHYRDRPVFPPPTAQVPASLASSGGYQIVTALEPHIVRKDHDAHN
jgi:hypothetical protein